MTLGRNDPCWCGSGLKYKRCHLLREGQKVLPSEAILRPFKERLRARTCWHPEADARLCDKIVNAHTVQRSRVLSALTDHSQHVLTFHPSHGRRTDSDAPSRAGWRAASTFPGFCSRHDNTTFASLERVPFTGTREQCFLLGYRALCHELHMKRAVVDSDIATRQLLDRGLPPDEQLKTQTNFGAFTTGADAALRDLLHVKSAMDRALIQRDFNVCQMAIVEFDGPVVIAGAGTLTPDVDLSGHQLQVLEDLSARCEWLGLASDVTTGGGAVVLTWLAGDEAPLRWVRSLLDCSPEKKLAYLPQIMLFHLENVYLQAAWWDALAPTDRIHLAGLATEPDAEYEPDRFSDRVLVPWSNVRVRLHGVA